MLLEELLGISNKRLKSILNGENLDAESSSTDSDDDPKPIDIISLDDISTDEDLTFIDCSVTSNEAGLVKYFKLFHFKLKQCILGGSKQKKRKHVKTEPKEKTIKKEKAKQKEKKPISSEDKNLMSVLELLELQARARAIRSQLALEAENKKKEEESVHKLPDDSDSEVLIVSSPKNNEIVICSSESESEKEKRPKTMENCKEGTKKKYEKIYFIQSEKIIQIASNTTSGTNMEVNQLEENVLMKDSLTEQVDTNQSKDNSKSDSENDEILNIHAENEIDM